MNKLPESFLERMKSILESADFDHFRDSYQKESTQSIRLNPKKKISDFDGLDSVKWYDSGIYLLEKKQFITDPLWHAGTYYVQEASSMILAEVYNQITQKQPPKTVLDLCAAPGGKSTLLQSLIETDSVLIANEVIKPRAQILKENHIRLGISENLIITQNDPRDFSDFEGFFDFVQIDAPCSGEGMFRKEKSALGEWSVSNCNLCAERQKRILADIEPAIARDGFLVYSTCTFNPKENEELMAWFCENFGFESVRLNFNSDWGISEVNFKQIFGYYFYPHRLKGEGLFVSVLRNSSKHGFRTVIPKIKTEKSATIPGLFENENLTNENGFIKLETNELKEIKSIVSKKLNILYSGVELGELKRNDFIPSQAIANFHKDLHHFQKIEVDQKTALEFLRGKDPELELDRKEYYLLTYKGFGLGWIKFIGNRSNNYYPKPWRIKNF